MVIAVSGPPHGLFHGDILHRSTLKELIALYLNTRQWKRDQDADRLESTLYVVEGTLSGGAQGWGKETGNYIRRMRDRIKELRGPEFPPELPPAEETYDADLMLVMRGTNPPKA